MACANENAVETLETAFEPMAESLGETWMTINDVERELGALVDQHTTVLGDQAPVFHHKLKQMDDLVFRSIEVMGNLLTLVRDDLAKRAKHAHGISTSAFDAYLQSNGADVHPLGQTEPNAAVVTPLPSPIPTNHKPLRNSVTEIFDLLRGRYQSQHAKANLEMKTESKTSTSGKKRLRSPTSVDANGEDDSQTRVYTHFPKDIIKDRRPIAVHGVRERRSQREYAVEFEGLAEYVWLVSRRSPPAVRELIQAYAQQRKNRRRKKRKEGGIGRRADASTAGEELDTEGIYIVDKIVNHRIRYGKKHYFVKWDGYDTDENTWEPAAKLRNEVPTIVDDYEREVAKAESRKIGEQVPISTNATMPSARTTMIRKTPKHKALGRPSNPSALTKSAEVRPDPSFLLQQSGKIPKLQFAMLQHSDDSDSEDSDLLRLAASDGERDDDESDDADDNRDFVRFAGKSNTYGKPLRVSWASPSIE